jgi:hypothetical protein
MASQRLLHQVTTKRYKLERASYAGHGVARLSHLLDAGKRSIS